jgi:hypothetical membrane protein
MKASPALLFRASVASTALLLIGSLFVNLNGAFPYLGQRFSVILTLLLFAVGIGSAIALAIADKRRRVIACILIGILVVLAIPAFL